MATNPTGGAHAPLIQRVKNILTTPKTEWPVIDSEPATIGGIYKNYVMILAAIGPVCGAIGLLLMGGPFFAIPVGYLIAYAVISYLLALAGCYILALIIEALAPTFGGTKDRVKAFKVAAYASTAAWVAGIFGLLPPLAILALVGLIYTFYLMYLGLPVLMKTSADKSVAYTAAIVVAAIVLYLVIGVITSRILFSMMTGPAATLPVAYPG
ncbi:MAG TPA: Yip1 family protein [Allosphingosinicella sp.]|nr:Yip1 family protein [Allosphingosinicella sp.]